MSHNGQPDGDFGGREHDEEYFDDDGFMDLDDPENVVVDDGDGDENEDDCDSMSDGGEAGPNANGEGEGCAAEAEAIAAEQQTHEDLNEAGDHVVLREDAYAVMDPTTTTARSTTNASTQPKKKSTRPSLFAVAAHPKDATLAACAGEADEVYLFNAPPAAPSTSEGAATVIARDAPSVRVLGGHTDTVTALAFAPSGDILASGGMDGRVMLWSIPDGTLLHELTDLSAEVECLLWHPSGRALLAGAADAQIVMWNAKTGIAAMYYAGHRAAVQCLLWAAGYTRIISGGADGAVMGFQAKTAAVDLSLFKGLSDDQAPVTALCLLPVAAPPTAAEAGPAASAPGFDALTATSEMLIVGCEDGTMHVVSLKTNKGVRALQEVHSQGVETIAACRERVADAPIFMSCACDCIVAVWDCATFHLRYMVNTGEAIITARWLGHHILAGCSDGLVRVFDGRVPLGEQHFVLPPPAAKAAANDDDARENAATADDLPVTSDAGLVALMGHRRMVVGLAVTADLRSIVTASDDGTARVFSVPSTI